MQQPAREAYSFELTQWTSTVDTGQAEKTYCAASSQITAGLVECMRVGIASTTGEGAGKDARDTAAD